MMPLSPVQRAVGSYYIYIIPFARLILYLYERDGQFILSISG